MKQIINLCPTEVFTSVTYKVESSLKMKMIKLETSQKTETIVKYIYIKRLGNGNHLIEISIESIKHENNLLIFRLGEDLNECTKKIIFEVDSQGFAQQINNLDTIKNIWYLKRLQIIDKYKQLPQYKQFFELFEQQLNTPNAIFEGIENKGVYGLLLSGILGNYCTSIGLNLCKTLPKFFNEIALNLKIERTIMDKTAENPYFEVIGKGELDRDIFNHIELKRQMRKAVNMYNLQVDFEVNYVDNYKISPKNNLPVEATQYLKAEIENLYLNETYYHLTRIS